MDTHSFNKNEVRVVSAHDVDFHLLMDFYHIMFPERVDELSAGWEWMNRSSFYHNKAPLVALWRDRVIAHAGMIPFNVFFDGRSFTASWFNDFAVLPEFQGRGLGSLLTQEWMKFSDVHLGCGNEKAKAVVVGKHLWTESHDLYFHYYLIRPFNHRKFADKIPGYIRGPLNILSFPFYKIIYQRYASSFHDFHINEITVDLLDKFLVPSTCTIQGNRVFPVRDAEYFAWRIMSSPYKNLYRVCILDDVSFLIRFHHENPCNSVDILLISDISKFPLVRRMISTLALWASKKGYSYIRYGTSHKDLSQFLLKALKPYVRRVGFWFNAKDSLLLENLKRSQWDWGLIDHDFEWTWH